MTAYASRERAALADLMGELGPDAPTLCEGWTTRDLAAHLIVRGTRADAAPGIAIRRLSEHTRRVQARVAARPWPVLLAAVRRRPWWAVMIDEGANRTEYFIHHEDVRRAQPGWHARDLEPGFQAALWSGVRRSARLALRRTPARVTITSPGHGTWEAGRGGPPVRLTGPPSELLLFVTGRQAQARVELSGPEEITSKMWTRRYGI